MGTKATKPKPPAAPAPANSAKVVTEDDVIAFLEAQQKGADILKKARNVVWRKIAAKQAKPELVGVFRQAVQVHGFADCKLAWNMVRKESAPARTEAKDTEEAE